MDYHRLFEPITIPQRMLSMVFISLVFVGFLLFGPLFFLLLCLCEIEDWRKG